VDADVWLYDGTTAGLQQQYRVLEELLEGKREKLKSVPATLSRKPFFVGHFSCDGCPTDNITTLFKTAVRVKLNPSVFALVFTHSSST
jgi:hypothetical protein